MTHSRRRFIRVIGGGPLVLAAGAGGLTGCDGMPAEAIAPWQGPARGETDPRRRALAYALLAPNPHNMQSWQVDLRQPDVATLYVDLGRLLPETDPFARQIMIGQGTFLEILKLAAAADGWRAEIALFPEGMPDASRLDTRPVARARFVRDGALAPDPLFRQVLHRRSNKEPYDPARPLRDGDAEALAAAHDGDAVSLTLTREPGQVEALRSIAAQAMRIETETPRTHRESIDRLRLGADEILAHRDGIDLHGPLFWWGRLLGLYTKQKAAQPGTLAYDAGMDYAMGWTDSAVAFGWMTTATNDRAAQVAAGRAYVRFNLKATELGVAMHPLSQVLQEYPEMTALRKNFLDRTGTGPGRTVQMLFRLGYAEPPGPSPRRPLRDLLRA